MTAAKSLGSNTSEARGRRGRERRLERGWEEDGVPGSAPEAWGTEGGSGAGRLEEGCADWWARSLECDTQKGGG